MIPTRIPMQVVWKGAFLGEFQRGKTSCIGNAVSHKCVLAFITKVDKSEWMLWRDCDNPALSVLWTSEICWHSCWSMMILQTCSDNFCTSPASTRFSLMCILTSARGDFSFFFLTVPRSSAQLFYYLNIFFSVSLLIPVCKVDSFRSPVQSNDKMSLTFLNHFMLCKTLLHWCNLSVFWVVVIFSLLFVLQGCCTDYKHLQKKRRKKWLRLTFLFNFF